MNNETLTRPGLAAVMLITAVGTAEAGAGAVILPEGLNPGDPYRIAFVTSDAFKSSAASEDIADYNLVVTNAANSLVAGLNTDWFALVSTPTVSARDNSGTQGSGGVPIFLVDGTTKIADDYGDLWDGTLDFRLNVNETGGPWVQADVPGGSADSGVWTGTLGDGSINVNGPMGGSGFSVSRGLPSETDVEWIETVGWSQENQTTNLYAISGVLTAVPEPTSLALLGVGGGSHPDLMSTSRSPSPRRSRRWG